MKANQVAVHEVDGRRMHMVLDELAEYAAVLGAEFADIGPAGGRGDLRPLHSHAYRSAVALLGVYRSRVDFVRHSALDTGADSLRYRLTSSIPALTSPHPAAMR